MRQRFKAALRAVAGIVSELPIPWYSQHLREIARRAQLDAALRAQQSGDEEKAAAHANLAAAIAATKSLKLGRLVEAIEQLEGSWRVHVERRASSEPQVTMVRMRATRVRRRESHGQRRGHRRVARTGAGADDDGPGWPRPAKRPATYTYGVEARERWGRA